MSRKPLPRRTQAKKALTDGMLDQKNSEEEDEHLDLTNESALFGSDDDDGDAFDEDMNVGASNDDDDDDFLVDIRIHWKIDA